jgi:tetratricopeptide (TPR) repeat protein
MVLVVNKQNTPKPNGQPQLTVDEAYKQAVDHLNTECYVEADRLCTAIIQAVPNHVDAINLLGIIAFKLNRHDIAIEQFQKAIAIKPDFADTYFNLGNVLKEQGKLEEAVASYQNALSYNSQHAKAYNNLGIALMFQGRLDDAIINYQKAISIKQDFVDAHSNLGKCHRDQGRLEQALLSFKAAISINPNLVLIHLQVGILHCLKSEWLEALPFLRKTLNLKSDIPDVHFYLFQVFHNLSMSALSLAHLTIAHQLSFDIPEEIAVFMEVTRDTLFLSSTEAYRVAQQGNRVKTGKVDALQICYYFGDEVESAPRNLVNLGSIESVIDYFATTKLRWPEKIVFDPANQKECEVAIGIATSLSNLQNSLQQKAYKMVDICAATAPGETESGKMRVLVLISRETVVLQASLRGIALALANRGHYVSIITEQDDMERVTDHYFFNEYKKINPHAVININHPRNSWLHPDVFNVVWWQDPTPEISKGEPMHWRERDLIFSLIPKFDQMLEKCGAKTIHRQDFCVDTAIFSKSVPFKSRTKVVFVGSSYIHKYDGSEEQKIALEHIHAQFIAGKPISTAFLKELSISLNFDDASQLFYLSMYVCRDTMVEWLCDLGREMDLDLEIYGQRWEKNDKVRPFNKGWLTPGYEVSRVYNEAKYVLSCHPITINSQRLTEVAASGAIPIVYDARPEAEPPYWEDECLLIKTQADLGEALTKIPKKSPVAIPKMFSFDVFAEKILNLIKTANGHT